MRLSTTRCSPPYRVVTTARLLERSTTKSSHPYTGQHSYDRKRWLRRRHWRFVRCRFFYASFTLSDIRQLLDVRQGVKSANPVF